MKINSFNTLGIANQLSRTSKAIARSLERMSSGKRVNRASDDPQAFAELVTLDSQYRGTLQAIRNMNDAQGLLQTADAAMQSQVDILQRMREIAVQGANGILTSSDRTSMRFELQQLYSEFARITSDTEFNGLKILDGSQSALSIQSGASSGSSWAASLNALTPQLTFSRTSASGAFKARTTTSVSANPWEAKIADFNGDGKLDAVTVNFNSSNISIALGAGDGTFGTATNMNVGSQPASIEVADVNGDGNKDLLVLNRSGTSTSVLLGNGNGTFKIISTVTLPDSGSMIATGDFNADGKVDFAVGDYSDEDVTYFMGNGNGTFAQGGVLPSVGSFFGKTVRIADLNRDGYDDIVTADRYNGLAYIFLSQGAGTFQTATTVSVGGSQGDSLELGDVNGDAILDIVSANSGNGSLGVAIGSGSGTFTFARTIATTATFGGNQKELALGDLNSDGILDVVYSDYGGSRTLMKLGVGDGTFGNEMVLSGSTQAYSLELADLNGDGSLDIIDTDVINAHLGVRLSIETTRSAISEIDVSSTSKSSRLIEVIDNALVAVKSNLSQSSSYQNRLNFSSDFASARAEALADAKSRLTDVDISQEVSELTRHQILQQVQVAALGQANVQMQVVLGLLKGFGR